MQSSRDIARTLRDWLCHSLLQSCTELSNFWPPIDNKCIKDGWTFTVIADDCLYAVSVVKVERKRDDG